MRWLTGLIDDTMTRFMEESKVAVKASSKASPKSVATATQLAKKATSPAVERAYQAAKTESKAASKAAVNPAGATASTSAKRPGDKGGREQQKEQDEKKITREQLKSAAKDLVQFIQNYVRSGQAHLPPKSPFTKLTQKSGLSSQPLVDSTDFIRSLRADVVGNYITVYFPDETADGGMTYRDLYNILSLGAHVPVTKKTRGYFGAKYGLHPSAPYYKIPARPFLRKAVMVWVVKNRKFAQNVVLPPY
jgi:hypothetical protein